VLNITVFLSITLPAVLLVGSQTLYVANKPTFGCTSIEETANLEHLRSQNRVFRSELYEQMFQGQCVEINRGKVVEGSIAAGNSSLLLIDRQIQPPGFIAPLRDFRRLKNPGG
jgi:hypothetical protein